MLKTLLFCAALSLGMLSHSALAAVTVTDDAGHSLTLARPAQRVISLAPSVTELLYAAGSGDKLVGVTTYSDYPPAALKVARIGDNQKLDLERIAALKPDLVLVWYHGNAQREIERLSALGLPMFYIEPRHLEDIPGTIERLGKLTASEAAAQKSAQQFRTRLTALRARYASARKLQVFYQVWSQPLLTINDKQIIGDVLTLCGGHNIFGGESVLVPQVSTESVVAANPDVILTAHMGNAGGAKADQAERAPDTPALALWRPFTSVNAVKRGELWLIPGDQISRHGPRILDGAQAVCAALDHARQGAQP